MFQSTSTILAAQYMTHHGIGKVHNKIVQFSKMGSAQDSSFRSFCSDILWHGNWPQMHKTLNETVKMMNCVETKWALHLCLVAGNEDCLTLNVFTRDLVTAKARPVVVFIHGGNFVRGSAADYQPDYILDEDVVLVTIQYRWDELLQGGCIFFPIH